MENRNVLTSGMGSQQGAGEAFGPCAPKETLVGLQAHRVMNLSVGTENIWSSPHSSQGSHLLVFQNDCVFKSALTTWKHDSRQ